MNIKIKRLRKNIMKKCCLTYLVLLFLSINVLSQEMTWVQTTIDYGTIPQQIEAECSFEFTNTGNAPLIIISSKPTCGCVISYHPKEPILPNETGSIKVKYNANPIGYFKTAILVETNAKNGENVHLEISGIVE